jgi:hypothetical protein
MVTDLVDPQELIDYVRAWDIEVLRPEAQLTLDEFLPNRLVDDLEFKIRKGALNDVDVAEYRAWDTQPRMTARPGTTYIEGSLGPVSRQIPLGEEESLRIRAMERQNNDPIVSAIFDDAERMVRSVQARIELARGDVINDGKVTISENGLQLEADFGRSGSATKTAANLWTDTSLGKPLTDLLTWQEDYINLNGVAPELVLMSRARLSNFALNTEMRQYASVGGTTPNRINMETVAAIMAAEGLPAIQIYDTSVRVNGVSTRVLPQNKVFLMPPKSEPVGHTFYGITAEAIELRSRGLITQEAMPGVVAITLKNENPVQTFTLGTAIALPVTPNPNLIFDCTVAA